ncbi:MAG: tRNA pseudouridine synthase B [Terrestrivirus sp.]|uniref:tRNA pseudouridine(55) synthase n=1 Tax=Terrestrivirus sp. TaxID=2487775 RepID=A0A3G4ZNZ7_9VIRU|nr:MAG: tRNA pseudouridine synthase B [Terrestrivirus sp.]
MDLSNGLFAVNKPKGISSAQFLNKIKFYLTKKFGRKIKIGHGGTLDPFATGVLVVGTGSCTKQLGKSLTNDLKRYTGTIKLGFVSDSYDSTGNIIPHGLIVSNEFVPTIDDVNNVIKKFVGTFMQKPPKYSAISINGKRAYDMARNNEEFDINERSVTIYSINIVSYQFPFLIIDVCCASGTYIRSLANDIGKELTIGAYLDELQRTEALGFTLDKCYDFNVI